MENTYLENDTIENHISNVSRKLFEYEHNPREDNLSGIFPLPSLTNNKQVNYTHSAEILSQDKDDFKSDESAYDSDCSLGSMNSLYSVLSYNNKLSNLHEKNSANEKCLLHEVEDASKIVKTIESKTISRTRILEQRRLIDKIDERPIKNFTTVRFYRNQESISRHINSRLSHVRQQKKEKKKKRNKKIFKARYLYNNFRKLRYSLKNRKYRSPKKKCKKCKNDKIRHLLKEPVPLLKLNRTIEKKMSQNSNSSINIVKNELIHNEDFHYIPYYHSVIIEQENNLSECNKIEYKLYEPNAFPPLDDFMDTDDDFGGTEDIDDIIKRLFEENISTDN